MSDSDEPLQMFCIHDADAAGTMIYQSLAEATAARPGRRVEVINLGLEAHEARLMGLEVETIDPPKNGRRPVAAYVHPDDEEWLQTHRVELNAMSSPEFLTWLDDKVRAYGTGKLVPPPDVQRQALTTALEEETREQVREQLLKEHDFEGRVQQALAILTPRTDEIAATIVKHVQDALTEDERQHWKEPIEQVAKGVVDEHLA